MSLKDGEAVISFVTGDTVYFTVKRSSIVDEIALQKIVTEFNEDGNCIIEIAPNDTKDLEFRSYVYDIQLNRLDGLEYRSILRNIMTKITGIIKSENKLTGSLGVRNEINVDIIGTGEEEREESEIW